MSEPTKADGRRRAVVRGALLLLAVGASTCDRGETPAGSLQRLGAAFVAKDRPTVERYLDIPRTIESAVDQIVAGATATFMDSAFAIPPIPGRTSGTGRDALASAFAVGVLHVMKPALRSHLEAAIARALAPESTPPAAVDPVGNLLGERPFDRERFRRQYRGVKKVQIQGNAARVDVEFHNDSTGITFVPQLKMEKHERYWRLVGFTNLAEIVQRIAAEKRAASP